MSRTAFAVTTRRCARISQSRAAEADQNASDYGCGETAHTSPPLVPWPLNQVSLLSLANRPINRERASPSIQVPTHLDKQPRCGGQLGSNWQSRELVTDLEADFNFIGIGGNRSGTGASLPAGTSVLVVSGNSSGGFLGTVGDRIG